jgi:metal-responsive CopG/Arc/MetJ family transcriptional regulator
MQESVTFGVSLPKELAERIDMDRGAVPRSYFLKRILDQHYNGRSMT